MMGYPTIYSVTGGGPRASFRDQAIVVAETRSCFASLTHPGFPDHWKARKHIVDPSSVALWNLGQPASAIKTGGSSHERLPLILD
jgi:hypothetical protein